jgi:CheY-like chemotaxis protein
LTKKKPKILIVDDNPTQRYVLTRLAEQAGYESFEAQSAEDALEHFEREVSDVVICDIKLPQMDGFDLCRKLKGDTKTKKVPVILVTSMYYASEREVLDTEKGRTRAKECGALEMFPRGEAIEKLPPLLQKLADRIK